MDVVDFPMAVGGGPDPSIMLHAAALYFKGNKAFELMEDYDVAFAVPGVFPRDGMEDMIGVVQGGHAAIDFFFRVEAGVEVVEGWRMEMGHRVY